MIDPFSSLADLTWHTVTVRLRNTRNVFQSEHPLFIFDAVFKWAAGRCGLRSGDDFFFHPHVHLASRIHKGETYSLDLVFPRSVADSVVQFSEALACHLENPANNFTLVEKSSPRLRHLGLLRQEHGDLSGLEEVCLEFLTPVPFKPKHDKRRWLVDRDNFFNLLTNRIRRYFDLELTEAAASWQAIRLLPYYWEFEQARHESKSTPGFQYAAGTVGPLYLRGDIDLVLSLLLVCSELHCGKSSAAGMGFYEIKRSRPFFDLMVADHQFFRSAMDNIELNSDIACEIAETVLDRDGFFDGLHDRVLTGCIESRPAKGFYKDKRRGGKRLIATLAPEDYLVHKFLHFLLAKCMDRMFEDASVGYRPGRSREEAAKMIREACAEGFCHVLESDIVSFYDNIDWDILTEKLRRHLPLADTLTLDLLIHSFKIPLEAEGSPMARTMGIIQGSPLSPILSNLYLDSFDEEMEARGFRLIRYADDFIILTRSAEEAKHAEVEMRQSLADLRLQPKEEKTRIAPIDTGFAFLGLSFGPDLDEGYVSAANLEKTLFIRSQFVFIGLDYDSIIIRKDKQLIGRFPIRQVAEVVIFGNNTISASVARRCVEEKIPISFCTPSGRYLSTLRPDSQQHFLVAGQHLLRHSKLDASEMITIAARIVTAKIHNYLAWLRERWPEESRDIRHQIEEMLAAISKASSIEAIRGFEGLAARNIFPFVNQLCKDPAFHCRNRLKRERNDSYNSLLDFAYSLLFTRLNVLLRGRGLNPYLGILHSHRDHYESLVCDLQEPFRCRIDRFVIKVLNLEVIKAQDFSVDEKGRHNLNSKAIGIFLEHFEREMLTQLRGDGGNLMQLLRAQVHTISEWVADRDGLRFYTAKD